MKTTLKTTYKNPNDTLDHTLIEENMETGEVREYQEAPKDNVERMIKEGWAGDFTNIGYVIWRK